MLAKNRKFKVTGASFYKNDAEEGDLVFFELDPDNPHDKNAIKVLNSEGLMLGHIPKENAKEIQDFIKGKYPYYCAKVNSTWEPDDEDFTVPEVLAHFANSPSELPYQSQEWKNNLHGFSRKPTQAEIKKNRNLFVFLIVGSIVLFFISMAITDSYLISLLLGAITIFVGIKWLIRDQ
jgi:hypothetical protein